MNHEVTARINHRSGYNCAMSVIIAYMSELGISSTEAMRLAPKPRSEGGKCGAFLAGKMIIERLKPEAVQKYECRFIELNGCIECRKLVAAHGRLRKNCNDYVGDAARLVEEILKILV